MVAMRPRTKVGNKLCSHTTPDGKSYMGEGEKLAKKFQTGNITKEELRKYADFLVYTKKSTSDTVIVKVWDGFVKMSKTLYENTYKPLGYQLL